MAISGLQIGLSALQSYQVALNVTSNNIANADNTGFVPSRTDFHATSGGAGVFTTISPEGAAAADSEQPSETDLTGEAVNLLEYKNGYLANAKAVQVQSDLLDLLLKPRS